MEPGDAPHGLITPDNDPLLDTALHMITDERYPTWSPGINQEILRIAYQTDRQRALPPALDLQASTTGDLDIFGSELIDITAPTLVAKDELGDNIMLISTSKPPGGGGMPTDWAPNSSREGLPGDTFFFSANVVDRQSFVHSVWVQVKDPDDFSTDSLFANHKLYGRNMIVLDRHDHPPGTQNGEVLHNLEIGLETDYQGIDVGDFSYYPDLGEGLIEVGPLPVVPGSTGGYIPLSGPGSPAFLPGERAIGPFGLGTAGWTRPDPRSYRGRSASYYPGLDDATAWTGTVFPPLGPAPRGSGDTKWLELYDDGPVSAGGHEPEFIAPGSPIRSVAGDGVYANFWTTPPLNPSDWYVDLIVYDTAVNPFSPGGSSRNWIIYDNIWGFSTQVLDTSDRVLYVHEHPGQKFLRALTGRRSGTFRPFPQFRWGTESQVMAKNPAFRPHPWRLEGPGLVVNDHLTFADGTTFRRRDTHVGRMWFTIPTLNFFGDTYTDPLNGPGIAGYHNYPGGIYRVLARGPIKPEVLNRYVPNRESQPNDIQDTSRTSRVVANKSIIWAAPYTGDTWVGAGTILDTNVQAALADFLGIDLTTGNALPDPKGGRLWLFGSDIGWAITAGGASPNTPFFANVLKANFGSDAGGGETGAFSSNGISNQIQRDPLGNFSPGGTPINDENDPDPWTSPNWFQQFFVAGPILFSLQSADGVPNPVADSITPRAGAVTVFTNHVIAQDNTGAGGAGSHVIFGTDLAGMGNGHHWELNGSTGQLPLKPLYTYNWRFKLIQSAACWMNTASITGQVRDTNNRVVAGAFIRIFQGPVVGSGFTGANGRYLINGLSPGGYGITVDAPGFLSFSKADATFAHAGDIPKLDILLTPASPGSVSGTVTDSVVGTGIELVTVEADLRAPPLFAGQEIFSAVTDMDGNYIIIGMPVGTYDIAVSAFPPQFDNPQPTNRVAQVNTAADTPGQDFTLDPLPSPLTVHVLEDSGGGVFVDSEDARVSLSDNTTQAPLGFSGDTDAAGLITFIDVPGGEILASAFKFGFRPGSAIVTVPQENMVEIRLTAAPSHKLFGIVRRLLDGLELGPPPEGVTIELWTGDGSFRVTTVDTIPVVPASPPDPRHNYIFTLPDIPEDTYQVRVTDPRFQPVLLTNVIVGPTEPNVVPPIDLIGLPGILFGEVREGPAGTDPIPDVEVTITSEIVSPGTVVDTVMTDAAGMWTTDPTILGSDLYTVTFLKVGYEPKDVANVFLGNDTDVGITLMLRAGLGAIQGRTLADLTNQAVRDVVVELFTAASSPFGRQKVGLTLSFLPVDANGAGPFNYRFDATNIIIDGVGGVPVGEYELVATGANYMPQSRFATLAAPITLGGVDFNLTGLPGVLRGTVREEVVPKAVPGEPAPAVVAGDPIEGAKVDIIDEATGLQIATTTTDANGEYKTPTLIPSALYTVRGSAFGFQTREINGVFVAGPSKAPDLLLPPVPPESISGEVKDKVEDKILAGATVEFFTEDGATLLGSTTTAGVSSGLPPRNYTLMDVPIGTYLVRASKAGYKPAEQTVSVNPGTPAEGVNFDLQPRHAFDKGLILISLPDDFPNDDPATVLGQDPGTFSMAAWNAGTQSYASYPAPPADRFRVGRGYFVRLAEVTSFTNTGLPTPDAPFLLPLASGWNLIGHPFTTSTAWLDVQVALTDGRVLTMQQAMAEGVILNGLFGFVDGYFQSNFLNPFAGYFCKAFQPCTLIVPAPGTPKSARALELDPARLPLGLDLALLPQVASAVHPSGLPPAMRTTLNRPRLPVGSRSLFAPLAPGNITTPWVERGQTASGTGGWARRAGDAWLAGAASTTRRRVGFGQATESKRY